jgi:hypothetical protein
MEVRIMRCKECVRLKEYLLLDGVLVRPEDVRDLPREWRLQVMWRSERFAGTERLKDGIVGSAAEWR